MARYTVAYSGLVSRLSEVETLLKMALKLERKIPVANSPQIKALCRGSAVLLSSHIEGYTKELGELTLSKIVENGICRSKISYLISYHASRDLISEIKDTSDSKKLAEKIAMLFKRDSPLWEGEGPFPKNISAEIFNQSFSSPSFDKIASYIGRFGYSEFKLDLERKLKGDHGTLKNLIDHIVDIRNKIAHGDSTVSKTPMELLEEAQLVKQFCRAIDDIFSAWCKENLCTIR